MKDVTKQDVARTKHAKATLVRGQYYNVMGYVEKLRLLGRRGDYCQFITPEDGLVMIHANRVKIV